MGKIATILLLISTMAFSATWWVHSANGDDTWPGTSPDSAFATLGAATASMTYGDTCRACGTFNESLVTQRDKHEGCLFTAWPDSAFWTIDGDTVRVCFTVGDYCGIHGKAPVRIRGMVAIDGSNQCVLVGAYSSAVLTACSLSTDDGGIFLNRAHVIVDSCDVHAGKWGLYLATSTVFISNSILESDSDYCISGGSDPSILGSRRNGYLGYGGVYGYSGISVSFFEDSFRVSQKAVCGYRYGPQDFKAIKCKFIGGQYGLWSSQNVSCFTVMNCIFDSVDAAIDMGNAHGDTYIANSIISRCNRGIVNVDWVTAEGLVIYDCDTDTSGLLSPISYYTFDPLLDSAKVARADSAKLVGVNSLKDRYAPLWDDLDHWFRNAFGVPAIGWRSPYSYTGWPYPDCEIYGIKWGIRSNGRRLK